MRRTGTIVGIALLIAAGCGSSARPVGSPDRRTNAPAHNSSTAAPSKTGASVGCGKAADAPTMASSNPGDVVRTLRVEGSARSYRLGIPQGYDQNRPTPLIMNLHGSGSDALQASIYGDFTQRATRRGNLTITPDAIDGRWQLAGIGSDNDFLLGLVRDVEARYCIDTDRVYLIGMSLGAWKAAATACDAPSMFAAVALVAVEVHPPKCSPIPVVAFHGTDDPTVPYGAGSGRSFPNSPNAGLPGTRENIASWAKGNGCDPEPSVTRIGSDVERWVYRRCMAAVELYTIFGGGHTWPGAKVIIGPTTKTIDATAIALDWFAAHPRTR